MTHKHILLLCLIFVAGLGVAFSLTRILNATKTRIPLVSTNDSTVETRMTDKGDTTVKLLFGGDLMFDRNIRTKIEANGADFTLSNLQPVFDQYDVLIANLEGPVTDFPSRSVGSEVGSTNNFIFTFDPMILQSFNIWKLNIVNLGNNHITNFGTEGVTQTKEKLQAHFVTYFGDTGTEQEPSERVAIKTIHNRPLAFVNYNQFTPNGFEHALEDIAYASQVAELTIMYTHWGNEYEPIANQVIQTQAHQFIDAGADLIIGSHPHVTQQTEVYKGKTIYYSLGNFVFDQYFSSETRSGLLVGVEIHPDSTMTFTDIPIEMQVNGQTMLKNLQANTQDI